MNENPRSVIINWRRGIPEGQSSEDAMPKELLVATGAAEPRNGDIMRIHVGCELSFDFPQTMPMIVTLNVHFSRFSDLEGPDRLDQAFGPSGRLSRQFWKLVQPPGCTCRPFHPRH